MVCLGNICINTLHKGDNDDDDDDDNNNNNNNNNSLCCIINLINSLNLQSKSVFPVCANN